VQAAVTEPARCFETLPATTLTVPKTGLYTFDLGQNMVGWVRLNISGNAGDRITVRHGEMLNPDGTLYTANLRGANATDFFTFWIKRPPRSSSRVSPSMASLRRGAWTLDAAHVEFRDRHRRAFGHAHDRRIRVFESAGEPAFQQHHLGPERQLSRSPHRLPPTR